MLFADISGFSKLAETLLKELHDSARAAEDLSQIINQSLSKMVGTICEKGGDVIKFAGDAILAVFPDDLFDDDLEQAVYCCCHVALKLLSLDLSKGISSLLFYPLLL